MSVEENKALIRHALELAKANNLDAFFDICDSAYVEHFSDHDESLEESKQKILNIPPVSDYSLTIDHLIAEGDKVAYRGTHRFIDQTTGKKIQMTSTCIVRIANGKIVENWVCGDELHVMQQYGVLPSTEEIRRNARNNTN